MKKFTPLQLLMYCLLVIGFYSCAPKYGAHFTNSSTFHKSEIKEAEIKQVDPDEIIDTEVAMETSPVEIRKMEVEVNNDEPKSNYAIVSNEKVIPVVPNPSIEKLVTEHKERVAELENSEMDSKEMKKELKKEKKRARKELKKEIKKEIKEIKKAKDRNAEDGYVLMMILAVIIPPLAVGLTYGIVDKFWISLLLTLLFWLPGAIYSLIVVHKHYT